MKTQDETRSTHETHASTHPPAQSLPLPPTVGRIVHVSGADGPRPAIVVGVNPNGSLDLCVFEANRKDVTQATGGADDATPDRWSWPPKAGDALRTSSS